jgi:ribosomal protein S18 acetylase RimI-like enzyme
MTVKIAVDRAPDMDKLLLLFCEAGWHDKTDRQRLEAMVVHSTLIATAWDGEEMVGFARCITDSAFNGQINNVVVSEQYRGQGIGRRLVETMLENDKGITYLLRADPDNADFYTKLGFESADLAFVFKRKQ